MKHQEIYEAKQYGKSEDGCEETLLHREVREADGYEYLYELTVKVSKMVASFNIPLYSVSVRMRKNGEAVSYYKTDGIFSDLRKAERFFKEIVDNLATPIDLPYVLEDLITI